MESKDVKMHQTTIKACTVQFERLHKTMKKTREEHGEFRKSMRAAMEQADYPTRAMIEALEAELGSFQYSFLPEGAKMLRSENDGLSVSELDQVVTKTADHLKNDLIPKLKKAQ